MKNSSKKTGKTNTSFGNPSFAQNGGSTHTTFGSASGGPKHKNHKNRAPAFGSDNAFGGNNSFGGAQTSFGGNGTTFGGSNSSFEENQTSFGAPTPKRGHGAFAQDGRDGPTPLSSPVSSFGNQPSGVRVRKKQITPNAAAAPKSDNPFAGPPNGGAQNAFGGAPTSAFPSTAFGKPPTDAATASQLEARMSGGKKSSFGNGNYSQGFGESAGQESNPFSGQSSAPRNNRKFPPDGGLGGGKAPKSSAMNGTHGKQRQPKVKKKPITTDEDTAFMPSAPHDNSNKAELSAATNLDGRCVDMCSPTERELHIRVEELSVFEKCFPNRPGTEQQMIIKRFQRSSADHKLDIPEEIRPPGVLRRTQLYIEQEIMDLEQFGPDPRFQPPRVPEMIDLYNFCWDRFRMIRKDFVLQNYRGAGGRVHPIVLDVHERIARYHVLSEHELIEIPSFVAQQNMEQLGQTLKSLNELYDESHKMGDPAYTSPFEAECRAYFILCTLDNGRGMDVLKYVKNLPQYILDSPHIKFAMRVFVARHTGDYYQFFLLLRQATYLQSCLLFRYIPNVRSAALLRMNRAYRGQLYPLEDLVELLCFDDIDHAYSVCTQHKLRISGRPGTGDDSSIVIKFGGDYFETDVQLRRSDEALEVRGSKIYVGMKQGNYLRRDICRGVTECASDEYPALSKLIQDFEKEERAKLYPDRPEYEDTYSYFVDYREGMPAASSAPAPATSANSVPNVSNQLPSPVQTYQKLDEIARKKMELEKKQHETLQRLQQLQQAKKEKSLQEQAKKAAAEQAAKQEEQARAEAIARVQAEKEAAEAKQQQLKLELQLREQKKQRELEEQRKRAEEAAREAERERLAAIQRAEALRAKAAEEERRRQEEIRLAELRRKEAEELERWRQQELAAERARREREAALEAERQARLAKEREERKRIRRAEKQRLAVLKLKLHIWKKYVHESRNGMGPVAIDAGNLRLGRSHRRANESVKWLFRGSDTDVPVGIRRLKQVPVRNPAKPSSDVILPSIWEADDVLRVVGASLRQQNPVSPSIAWKLVIADLMDGDSSFGLWCAVRGGTQDSTSLSRDCHRVFRSNDRPDLQGIAVCCRYLTGGFPQYNTCEAQEVKLASTSAILLPVDLKSLEETKNCGALEQQLCGLLSSLSGDCRVVLSVLGLASADFNSTELLNKLEASVRRVESRFATHIAHVTFEMIRANDSLPQRFGQTLTKLAALSPPVGQLKSVGLKELLEGGMNAMMNQCASSMAMQTAICSVFPRIQRDILSSRVMDLTYPPPELQHAVVEPQPGWNSPERRHEIKTVLTALEVTRIAADGPVDSVNPDQVCDVYFKKIVDFIDRLFLSYEAATEVSTYELKKRMYGLLLPVHEQLTASSAENKLVSGQAADTLLPWRKIFDEIYGAFFETMGDITIYFPVDWRRPEPRTLSLLDTPSTSALSESPMLANRSVKRDRSKVVQPVKVSLESFQRSFGNKSLTAAEASQEYRAVGEMKRLRVAIEKERAAASDFQRMLRQELKRWSADDGLL